MHYAHSDAGTLPFLEELSEYIRALPNHIARSSLFAPVAKGPRKIHHETKLITRIDAEITYSGEQLDEADADLLMQLIHKSVARWLGKPVKVNRADMLREMGRSTGKHDYDWLHRRMRALTKAKLFIEAKGYRIGHTEAFHLLQSFTYDEFTGTFSFTLDTRWEQLFGNREFAKINWQKRLQIGRGQDMSKALQRLIATSSDKEQRNGLAWLKPKLQYTGRMRDFKVSVQPPRLPTTRRMPQTRAF